MNGLLSFFGPSRAMLTLNFLVNGRLLLSLIDLVRFAWSRLVIGRFQRDLSILGGGTNSFTMRAASLSLVISISMLLTHPRRWAISPF